MKTLDRNVLLLNQNYEPLSVCNARRAIVLIFRGKAEVIEPDGDRVHSVSLEFPLPSVVRLVFYVHVPRRDVHLTRANVIKRDRHRCQYCGTAQGTMTTDHVVPKTLSGEDSWENLVCACVRCNNTKGNRTPEQAHLHLVRRPRRPDYFTFVYCFTSIANEKWRPYLFLE